MPAPVLISTLTLSLEGEDYECQLSNARIETSNSETTVKTFCGNYTSNDETYSLILEGYQDWGTVDSLCDLLWASAESETTLTSVMVIGGETFTCEASGRKPPAGGAAGDPLNFTITLPIQGAITKA
jgi:hypothetical protein